MIFISLFVLKNPLVLCVCAFVRVCVYACVRACVWCVCVCMCVCVQINMYYISYAGVMRWLIWLGVGLEIVSTRKMWVFSSQTCADSLSVCPTPMCIRTHNNDHVRTLKIISSPCQSSVDYGNMKTPSMHFTDRRINVLPYSKFNSKVMSLVKYKQYGTDLHIKKLPLTASRFQSFQHCGSLSWCGKIELR